MNKLQKELYEKYGKARMYVFYNRQTGKTVNYKVYNSHRKLIVITDDCDYVKKILMDKG